ncbi:MAG: FkbM family methyltransferase [Verrucomicrobiota bacterium]
MIRKIAQRLFPGFAAWYRQRRDQRMFAAQRMRPTALGFDFIGVAGMPESRTASGEVTLLRSLLRGQDLFVDVGANCGLYTLLACQAGVPTLAVEPNDLNFRRLAENLQHNRFAQAKALNVALGDQQGKCLLYGGGEGASLLKNWGGMASTYAREVEVETLDGLLGGRATSERVLIKVDVEGHELAVLAGARQLLARAAAPCWIIEHSFRENQDGLINPSYLKLFEVFWTAGYACETFDLERRPVLRTDVERWLATGVRDFGGINLLFRKP